MRSSQNAGGGGFVYSLGGLGRYHGTLTNNPTWGADGMNFNGTTQYVALPDNSFGVGNNPCSVFAFSKNNSIATRQVVLSEGDSNNSTSGFTLESPNTDGNIGTGMAWTNNVVSAASISWQGVLIGNTSVGYRGKNGGSFGSFTLNNTLNKTGLNCGIGVMVQPRLGYFNGDVSLVATIAITPTSDLNTAIYNLYKNTLGQGLSLP